MFRKAHAIGNLNESTPLDAQGERHRGKDVRIIAPTPGQYLHTVREGERLDLLSFKYYGNASRWWQISDANPAWKFPTDLLNREPLVDEQWHVIPAGFLLRFYDLEKTLNSLVKPRKDPVKMVKDLPALPVQRDQKGPNFIESTLIVSYATSPETRQEIIAKINEHFTYLHAFTCEFTGGISTEAFTFEDSRAKSNWRKMMNALADRNGTLEVYSNLWDATVRIVYNSEMLGRQEIRDLIINNGFDLPTPPITLMQVGAKIVIPPNRVV